MNERPVLFQLHLDVIFAGELAGFFQRHHKIVGGFDEAVGLHSPHRQVRDIQRKIGVDGGNLQRQIARRCRPGGDDHMQIQHITRSRIDVRRTSLHGIGVHENIGSAVVQSGIRIDAPRTQQTRIVRILAEAKYIGIASGLHHLFIKKRIMPRLAGHQQRGQTHRSWTCHTRSAHRRQIRIHGVHIKILLTILLQKAAGGRQRKDVVARRHHIDGGTPVTEIDLFIIRCRGRHTRHPQIRGRILIELLAIIPGCG